MQTVVFKYPKTEQEWRRFKNVVQREVNRANSMLEKLERNNLENTPAYHTFTTAEGRARFGIKGKTNKEVNEEYQRVKNFLDNETATVKGAKQYLKNMANITGLTYEQAKTDIDNFWKIADEVRKGLQAAKQSYLALDSERVIDSVRSVIEQHESGAKSIQTMGDAVEAAFASLQEELPAQITTETAAYLDNFINQMDYKGEAIYLNL